MKTSEFTFRPIQNCPAGCLIRTGRRLGIVMKSASLLSVGWLGAWDFENIVDDVGRAGALFDTVALAYKFHWAIVEDHRDGCEVYSAGQLASFTPGSLIRTLDDWLLVFRNGAASGHLCYLRLSDHALCEQPQGAQAHFTKWRLMLGELAGPDAVLLYER